MLVSVIIPCFNVESYIEDCVQSAFGQSHKNIEVICIDNNSTDSTWDKLTQLKNSYPELILDKEAKKGAPAARNKGLALAKGEWVQFLDADDLLLSNKIQNQVNLISPEISMIIGPSYYEDIHKIRVERFPLEDIWKGLFMTRLGNTCSNLFRRTSLLNIGGWDENYSSSQESKLMFELLKNNIGVMASTQLDTVIQERAGGQISSGNPEKKWLLYTQLREEIISFLKKEKEEYYKENKEFFNSKLFEYIRIYSVFNLEEAFIKYKANFEPNYLPNNLNAKLRLSYRVLGYKTTNLILNKIKKGNKY